MAKVTHASECIGQSREKDAGCKYDLSHWAASREGWRM